jgi:hypothetical protein
MPALEGAVAWKLQLIRDRRRHLADDIEAERKKEEADLDKLLDMVREWDRLREEQNILAGNDPEKKKEAVIANLKHHIEIAEGVLRILVDGGARLDYEREIAALKDLLAAVEAGK